MSTEVVLKDKQKRKDIFSFVQNVFSEWAGRHILISSCWVQSYPRIKTTTPVEKKKKKDFLCAVGNALEM